MAGDAIFDPNRPGWPVTDRPSEGASAGQLAQDRCWLRHAIELSRSCPPSATAFSVGAVIVGADSRVLAEGYSRDTDPHVHAEESALARTGAEVLTGATIYSSLEPCSTRRSRPRPCADLILAAGIRRVVFALREPSVFVPGRGAEVLRDGGAIVLQLEDLAEAVKEVNAHLLR